MTPPHDFEHVRMLEEQLLDQAVRVKPEIVAGLLADDFLEFGRSGCVHSKNDVVRSLANEGESSRALTAHDFRFRSLAEDVVQITYRTVRSDGAGEAYSLRSSIWKRTEGRWQMLFHQGTPSGTQHGEPE
ncbi:nuclear transport factor 2 family protein [Ancylobacter defluvii]|uniref:DUF4440 domain-containing protein n=1 Tax=Ancylobacter defluvii TaxID=1282440 RepID=A0A9W6JWL9_9HYPH|nr:DUF4440 domain-containing protein [Ancylobacter defluvii]MBS7590110.1 nuclear transport factor 2 family protein [Ancylobacter defluvii]GLK82733.1 hypothetical protein GCM10017653_08020 [Ancylobacter defluvii]